MYNLTHSQRDHIANMKVLTGSTILCLAQVTSAVPHRLNADVRVQITKKMYAHGYDIFSYNVLEPTYEFGARPGDTDVAYHQTGVCVCALRNKRYDTGKLKIGDMIDESSCKCSFAVGEEAYEQRLHDMNFGTNDQAEPYPLEPFELLDNEELNEPPEQDEGTGTKTEGESVEGDDSDLSDGDESNDEDSELSECEGSADDSDASDSDEDSELSDLEAEVDVQQFECSASGDQIDAASDSVQERVMLEGDGDSSTSVGSTHEQRNASLELQGKEENNIAWMDHREQTLSVDEKAGCSGSGCEAEEDRIDTKVPRTSGDSPYPSFAA